ncbi:AIM24 family protein [Candidatus Cyanaurora vandensis]|uniref:AIM24 family protein n=1 Tax=Candidatus Cyanaurora vandensis TaxID=2714958 RepID=UPI002579B814|nr:AIM24 family protein [Candidatus Cyanaurora vandensis]
MAQFEILEREELRLVKVTLTNETVRTESGALYYMIGPLTMETKAPSAGSFLKSLATGETVFRPTYTGTGELFLEPSFASFHVLELNNEEWVLDRGAYWASEAGITVDAYRDKVMTSLMSGEGFLNFQTKIKGTGQVVLVAQGPVQVLHLNNDKLVVDGSFAVARTLSLDYSVERATKSLFGTMSSGEFLVNTYRGTGTVLIAPFPNRNLRLIETIRGLLPTSQSPG